MADDVVGPPDYLPFYYAHSCATQVISHVSRSSLFTLTEHAVFSRTDSGHIACVNPSLELLEREPFRERAVEGLFLSIPFYSYTHEEVQHMRWPSHVARGVL